METRNSKDSEQLIKSLGREADKCRVRKPLLINPNIIVTGIDNDIKPVELVKNLAEKNDIMIEVADTLKYKFTLKSRNHYTFNAIFEVSPNLYKQIMKLDYLYLGMTRCRVNRLTRVIKCFQCQKYGHISTYCPTKEIDVCGKCAGDHPTKECRNPNAQ